MTDKLFAWLCLKSAPGIKSRRLLDLVQKYPDPVAYVGRAEHSIYQDAGLAEETAEHLRSAIPHPHQVQIGKLCEHYGIDAICYGESDYPIGLANIVSPPLMLFYRGDLHKALGQIRLAVVGTRKPTAYGRETCARLLNPVCAQPVTIISGLASGIDTVAHSTAVKNGAMTIAVLGHGVDSIYPQSNKDLAEQIVAQGALLSEFEPGTRIDPWNFPARNRIISALASNIFIVEGALSSGAMLTAKYAIEQGRDVMALPGEITHPNAQGPNYLIKNGAQCITSPEDILSALGLDAPAGEQLQALPDISPDEQLVYDLFRQEQREISFDELLLLAGHSIGKLSTILLNLELKGYLVRSGGNTFILA